MQTIILNCQPFLHRVYTSIQDELILATNGLFSDCYNLKDCSNNNKKYSGLEKTLIQSSGTSKFPSQASNFSCSLANPKGQAGFQIFFLALSYSKVTKLYFFGLIMGRGWGGRGIYISSL